MGGKDMDITEYFGDKDMFVDGLFAVNFENVRSLMTDRTEYFRQSFGGSFRLDTARAE
jgi:hypothetical protein